MTDTMEIRVGFLSEAAESLARLDEQFVAVEQGDSEAVAQIFRAVHSIKGNAATLGFAQLAELAHELESLLDLVRSGRKSADRQVIDTCLAGLDGLRAMIARLQDGGVAVADEGRHRQLLARFSDGSSPWPRVLNLARSLQNIPGHEADAAALLDQLVVLAGGAAGSAPGNSSAGFAASASDPGRELGDLIIAARAGSPGIGERIDSALATLGSQAGDSVATAAWRELVEAYRGIVAAVGFDAVAIDVLADYLPRTLARGRWGSPPPANDQPLVPVAAPASARGASPESESTRARQSTSESSRKSLRVPEAEIDGFLDRIGDLLVAGDGLGHLVRRLAAGADGSSLVSELRRASRDIAVIGDRLQATVMGLRRIPLSGVLRKSTRIARDVAAKSGKDIAVTIDGEDLAVDKALIETLDAAVLHIVRNAADHGLETPEVRARAGKPRQGTIRVAAEIVGSELVLSIADDGRGIDVERVRAKAEKLGLVAPGAAIGERELIDFIFAAGVSTAEKVSDISGRGVGLDAVKRAVEGNGGAIHIDNRPGQGCSFRLHLPVSVSTQIIPAYVCQTAGQPFGLPMALVGETFRCPSDSLRDLGGGSFGVLHHGRTLPIIDLRRALGVATGSAATADGLTVVTVDAGQGQLGVVVEGVLGVQQVVVRPIDGDVELPAWITGAALMGDGSIAMMLDLPRLMQRQG
jgi:two-component system chemotaxis sensor kinase CheA